MIAKNIVISEDSQEFIKPILPGLPISVFYTSFQENTYNCINWHWHEAFQYCLITEGTVDFLIDQEAYVQGNYPPKLLYDILVRGKEPDQEYLFTDINIKTKYNL